MAALEGHSVPSYHRMYLCYVFLRVCVGARKTFKVVLALVCMFTVCCLNVITLSHITLTIADSVSNVVDRKSY